MTLRNMSILDSYHVLLTIQPDYLLILHAYKFYKNIWSTVSW